MTPHDPAQLQDGIYSIGGGSLFIHIEGYQEVAEWQEPQPSIVIVSIEASPEIAVETFQMPPEHTPAAVRLPWWRHLWILLNMDIRDLFHLR